MQASGDSDGAASQPQAFAGPLLGCVKDLADNEQPLGDGDLARRMALSHWGPRAPASLADMLRPFTPPTPARLAAARSAAPASSDGDISSGETSSDGSASSAEDNDDASSQSASSSGLVEAAPDVLA